MKHLSIIAIALIAIAMASCSNQGSDKATSKSTDSISKTDSTAAPSKEVVDELNKAVKEEHADPDAQYSYDAATNTVKMVKQVDIPAGQAEEDFAEALVEHQVPEFIKMFKQSTKPSDQTIKSKGATITVSYVNKATGEEITQFDITPEDLK
ncbi:MAG: hypothetical protein IKX31_10105 [Muribaculaceae bacterium]|nr:hypothetical protein [Muribaculaceae bacterium]